MALVICAVIGILLGMSVWIYPRLFIMNLLVTAVGVEIIHHWYAGIGQYFPWIAVFLAGILQAGPSAWKKWWQFILHNKEWMAVYGLYFISIGISTLMGIHVSTSLRYALGVPAVLFIAVVIVPWSVEKRLIALKNLLQVIALMGVVLTVTAGIAAIADHLGFPVPVGHHILLAWQWPFANKNTFGMLVTFALPASVYLALDYREDGIIRIFWFMASMLLFIGVALSYSRSSWIASMIGVMMFVTFYYGKRGVLAMFGIGIVLLAGLIAKTGLHKWQLLWHKGLNGRIVLWKAGLDAMHHHWVWGVGPGNSPLALKPFVPAIYAGLTPSDSILRSAVELGLVGLGLWLLLVGIAMIGLLMRRPWHNWDDNALFSIMLASLAQQVVESLFVGGVSFGDFFFTVFLGLAWYRIWVVPKNRSLRSNRLSRRALLG